MFNLVRKIQNSIFIKLVLILIATDVLTISLIHEFLEIYLSQHLSPFQKNVIRYTNYLIQEIGTPPDTLKAREIAQELSIDIRFENSDFQWATNPNFLLSKNFDRMSLNKKEPIITELDHGVWMISVNHNFGYYFFAYNFDKIKNNEVQLSILLIIILTLVFTAAYFLIRWILKPIHWLTGGIERIIKGNLQYQVPLRGTDELGLLTESFNSMTRRIQDMIRLKEQLLLDVSHELRSPLTRMKVALEFVSDGPTRKSIEEDLSEVEKMITEILETERLNSSHGKLYLAEENISEIIKEVAQSFKDELPGIKLIAMPVNVPLKIDLDRVKTVFKNVLENSMKYSSSKSQPVEITVTDEKMFVVIQIKDYGPGIPQEELPYLFEPFYRIDKSRSKDTGGYGLGLSLCKKIMEAHGGTIEISSKLNIGTTVFLKFAK